MATTLPSPPKIGMVSLGCPKNLVDSERILTKLRSDGYQMSPDYAGADVVLVNTCGFLDSAKEESLEAIGEAIAENGRVIVTGCMGKEAEVIRAAHVLLCTCAESASARVGESSRQRWRVRQVLVDEAAFCTEQTAMLPVASAIGWMQRKSQMQSQRQSRQGIPC